MIIKTIKKSFGCEKMDDNNKLIKANIAWENKDYEVAKNLFEEVILDNPNEDIYLDYAILLQESNQTCKAKKTYEKMISLYPSFASGYYGLATIYDDEKSYDKAIFYYEECLQYDNTYDSAYFNLGGIFEDLKDYQKAKINYEKAIMFNPKSFWAYLNLGHIYEIENQNQRALELFLKAKTLEENSIVYFNLGVVYRKLNKIDDAINAYYKALEFEDVYPYTFLNLAVIYKDCYKNYDKALKIYNEGIKLFPKMTVLYYNRACIYAIINEYEKSIDDLIICIELDKDFIEYMKNDMELKKIDLSRVFFAHS